MKTLIRPVALSIFLYMLFNVTGIANATTLSEVLDGIDSVRKPSALNSLSFMGDLRLDLVEESAGLVPEQANFLAAWRSPDDWFSTWELSGALASGLDSVAGGSGHIALDHLTLSRPDFVDVLTITWDVEYQGTALWDGEPAWQLICRPKDIQSTLPDFNLVVRKDDFVPLRTGVDFIDGSSATTDLEWITIDNVLVPAKFTTSFGRSIGPLKGFATTFFNHEINPDLSGIDFPGTSGTLITQPNDAIDEGPSVYDELYHGFADDPITASIEDSSGTYTSLEFTFSLYVEDLDMINELNNRKSAITDLAIQIVSGWDWSGDDGLSTPSGKWDCGREIMRSINELLITEAITDFYFLDFEPLED